MSKLHVIVGNTEDYHALAVAWALRRMDEEALVWDGIGTADIDSLSIHFRPERDLLRMGECAVGNVASVWFRRPVPYKPMQNVHPDSEKFATNELRAAHLSCGAMLQSMADFVIGSNAGTNATSKAWQLRVAVGAGFTVPETLMSNDYEEVRSFIDDHSPVVVKYFTPHVWSDERNRMARQLGPTILTRDAVISEASVRLCPAIYQPLINKAYEIRVTVIGEKIFGAKIPSPDGIAYLDWRPESAKKGFLMSAIDLDYALIQSTHALVGRLGLVYGCIDLAVDTDGVAHFFEINTGGQFLFVDDHVPEFNLLGSFAAMMASRCTAYDSPPTDTISLKLFEESQEFERYCSHPNALRMNDRYITKL